MVFNRSRLERAYDTVGLYADSAWTIDSQDKYFHANQVRSDLTVSCMNE